MIGNKVSTEVSWVRSVKITAIEIQILLKENVEKKIKLKIQLFQCILKLTEALTFIIIIFKFAHKLQTPSELNRLDT